MKSKSKKRLVEVELVFGESRMRVVERAAAYAGEPVENYVLNIALAHAEEEICAREASGSGHIVLRNVDDRR